MKKNENFNKNNKKTIITMITKKEKKYRQDDTKQGGGGYDMAIRLKLRNNLNFFFTIIIFIRSSVILYNFYFYLEPTHKTLKYSYYDNV
jgi:hypothetical protein